MDNRFIHIVPFDLGKTFVFDKDYSQVVRKRKTWLKG